MAIVLDGSSAAGSINLGTNGTVSNLAVGGLPDGTVDSDTLATSVPLGITEIDQWSVTSDVTSNTDPVTNWARQNNTSLPSNAQKGTGMSHSSGVFTFPSTGYWLVMWSGGVHMGSADGGVGFNLKTTVDNGSNWQVVSNIDDGSAGAHHGHITDQTYLDITDVSNHKVAFSLGSVGGSSKLKGSTSQLMSNATFIRLGGS